MRRAWLLNLDADDELADPSARTSSRRMQQRTDALIDRLVGLVPEGDLVLTSDLRADGLEARAFCPTPGALADLRKRGARVPVAPRVEVLRRVNHRRFCAELGQTLDGARFVASETELREVIAMGGAWLLKRPFGFAGRGRRRVERGVLAPAEERWIAVSLARGEGLQVEPWVARTADFALHGFLSEGGALTLGEPTEQRCDEHGAWLSTERATSDRLSSEESRALLDATTATARALATAGYFGPFGVDAFRYIDERGARWNPRCEINARYSMGWAIGMADKRPDLA